MSTNAETQVARRRRIKTLLFGAGLVAALAILLLGVAGLQPPLDSPADAVRPYAYEYNRTFAPETIARKQPFAQLTAFTLTTNGQNITLSYAPSPGIYVDVLGPAETHHADRLAIQLPGGPSIQMTRMGFAGLTHSNLSWTLPGNRLTATFFTPEFKPIESGQLYWELPKASERALPSGRNFPTVSFDFKISGPAHRVIEGFLFDARTHSLLERLTPESLSTGEQRLTGHPFLWHGAPVLLVLDLAMGPLVYEFVEPRPGAVFKVGDVSGQILFAGSNVTSIVRKMSTGPHKSEMEFITNEATNDSFIYYGFANIIDRSCYELIYVDAANEPQPIRLDQPFGDLRMMRLNRGIEKGDRLGAARYTRRKQVVFRLPGIPGLPEENRNAENLFSVKVPYLRFNDAAEQMAFILGATQLSSVFSHKHPNRSLYPREFTNVTVADVVMDYSTLTPSVIGYTVDQTHFTLQESAPGLRTTLDKLKKKLGWP